MKRGSKKVKIVAGSIAAAVVLIACGICGFTAKIKSDQAQQAAADQKQVGQELLAYAQNTTESLATDTIYPGVTVMGVELGGLTLEEATATIQEKIGTEILDHTVTLKHGDHTWSFTYKELGVSADSEAIAAKAYAIGRSGSQRQRKQVVDSLLNIEEVIEVDTAFDEEKLNQVVQELAKELDRKPVNAEITMSGETFTVTDEKKGLALDQEKTKKELSQAMEKGEDGVELTLSVKETDPERTAEKLKTIQDRIGSYSTYYNAGNYGRSQNLMVGASKISGRVLMPDEVFSFNEAVAPITVENGYYEANVIVGDEYVPGLGGGLCQVSTTLYNAVIRAELEVLERDCHAFPSDYVPMGLDAAVASGYLDFQFKNTSGHPIYLVMWCGGGEIGASIYGTEIHDPSRSLSFDYVITGEYPKPPEVRVDNPNLAPGEVKVVMEGHIGYSVDVYKTVSEKGESYTEWFSSSTYMSSADKVEVGPPKKDPPPSKEPPKVEKPKEPESSAAPEESEKAE